MKVKFILELFQSKTVDATQIGIALTSVATGNRLVGMMDNSMSDIKQWLAPLAVATEDEILRIDVSFQTHQLNAWKEMNKAQFLAIEDVTNFLKKV